MGQVSHIVRREGLTAQVRVHITQATQAIGGDAKAAKVRLSTPPLTATATSPMADNTLSSAIG